MTFGDWLQTQPYRPTTRKRSLTDLRYAQQQYRDTQQVPRAALASIRRYMLYVQEFPPLRPTPFDQALAANLTPSRKFRADTQQVAGDLVSGTRALGRTLTAKRIPEAEWLRLVEALKADTKSREATVLLVITASGLRIGDVLRIRKRDLTAAKAHGVLQLEIKGGRQLEVPTGGVPEVWARLNKHFQAGPDDNIATWVSVGTSDDPEAGAAAYKRCARYLQALCRHLGLTGRIHLHRLRRTVAVKALLLTRDVHAVQQLLGHKALSSTLAYVDELRQADVERLQRQLQGGL